MTPEAPECRTNPLSPLSPLPLLPSETPILQNETDTVFNMTSTDLEPAPIAPAPIIIPTETAPIDASESPSSDSSFSDAYKEQAAATEDTKVANLEADSDVSDDYAMAVDSDGEERADSQDISQAKFESDTKSLPPPVSNSVLPSTLSHDPAPTAETQYGQAIQPIPTNPAPIQPVDNGSTNDSNSEHSAVHMPNGETKYTNHTYEDVTSGGIDIQQLLDNITANAEKNDPTSAVNTPSSPSKASFSKGSSGLPTHSSLPPRPNNLANLPSNPQMRPSTTIVAAGAPGTSTDPRVLLPPPPSASFRSPVSAGMSVNPAPYSQINRPWRQRQTGTSIGSDGADETDAKWGPEVQKIYDDFLVKEREYVENGSWSQFPLNSRLFIGNLASEAVTKRDLFHIFHKYGQIAQISIKQAYGFIQFYSADSCLASKKYEQGQEVRGKRMALEVSKPQKNNPRQPAPVRRSHSPDYPNYMRGGAPDRGGRPGGRNALVDRYDGRDKRDGRAAPTYRPDEYGRPIRVRDDYRPLRSPSPPRGNFRGRDEYMPRGRDSYDSHDRQRSRSPYGYRDNGGYRERSLSPRRREANEDAELEIPRRSPADVPDVQILLLEQLDRQFVSWVENEMSVRGIKVEVMFLNPRLPLQAIVRRQILEGVHAVSKLDMRCQHSSKIPLQVFDRQGGANNVRFDEYQDLEPKIAAELVIRAKKSHLPHQVQNPQYGQPQFPPTQAYPPQVTPSPAANLASLVGQLDNATLQKLLSGYQLPQQQQNAPAVAANNAIDFAGLLGGLKPQQVPFQQGYQQPPQQPQSGLDPYANIASNPTLASLLQNTAPPQSAQMQPQQSDQQVQNIMAQLARFRQ